MAIGGLRQKLPLLAQNRDILSNRRPFEEEGRGLVRATPRRLDSFRDDLGYCLRLLIGFNAVEVDHGGRLTAMGGVGPQVVVEGDPASDTGVGLRAGFPGVEIDAFILQGPPEAFD